MTNGEERRGDGELPEGWRWVRLGDAVSVKGGKRLPAGSEYAEGPTRHPYIRVVDFADGSVRTNDLRYIDAQTHDAISRYTIRSSDVYISIAGTIGVAGRVPPELDGANLTENAAKLTPDGSLDPNYLWRALSSPSLRAAISDATISTTQPKLALFRIEDLQIPLPPLPEQRRIVAKLESLQARSRRAREALEAVPALLEKLRQSILAAAFRGDLTADWRAQHPDVEPASELLRQSRLSTAGTHTKPRDPRFSASPDRWTYSGPSGEAELPYTWSWAPLCEVMRVVDPNPSHRYPEYEDGTVPIVSTQEFRELDDWDLSRAKLTTSDVWRTQNEACHFEPSDVVFARKGRLGLARHPPPVNRYTFSHTVFVLKPRLHFSSDYVMWHLRRNWSLEWLIREMNSNTGVPTLGKSVMEMLPTPVAPKEEQAVIVSRVRTLMQEASRTELCHREMLNLLKNIESAFLSKAFRGELVPQDPNDVTDPPSDAQTTRDVPAPTQAKSSSRSNPSASKAFTDRTSGKTRRSPR